MAHARPEDLLDIADVLDEVRALPGVAERSPGVFYIGRDPFLHFHTKAGARWADARAGREWGQEMPLPFGPPDRAKSRFVKEIRRRYEACTDTRGSRGEAARSGAARSTPPRAPAGRWMPRRRRVG
jgi:hypothetical protein